MELNTALISRLEKKTGIHYLGLIRQEEYKSLKPCIHLRSIFTLLTEFLSVDYCYR